MSKKSALLDTPPLFEIERPPLVPVTMADVRSAEKTNGLNMVSTFSGAGGTCLGYRLAGFDLAYACEFIPAARETYLANFPDAYVDDRDVREVSGADLLAAVRRVGYQEIDVLEGSPPCSAFSTAGKREAGWGEVKKYSDSEQRVDDLFFEWTRLVREAQPRVCIAENVPGLAVGAAVDYLERIIREIRSAGYLVDVRTLNAADYGVPQARERLFVYGVRRDLGLQPAWPIRTATYGHFTVEDCLDYVRTHGGNDAEQLAYAEMDPQRFAIGREWPKIKEGESSDRYFQLTRAHRHLPSPTVTAITADPGAASVCHPYECRKFTVRELRLICSFPVDFVFTGPLQKHVERMGRAVPPLLAQAVATAIAGLLAPFTQEKENLW